MKEITVIVEFVSHTCAETSSTKVRPDGLGCWLLLFGVATMLVGCKERPTVEDKVVATFAVAKLEDILQHDRYPLEYKERAKTALREFKSKEPNTVPIFIYARLSHGSDPNEDCLYFMCFDKARDLQGIRIREQHRDSNGALSLIEEDYPIFVDSLESWTLERRVIPFRVRDASQRKDEKLWLEYENRLLKVLVQETVATKHKQSGQDIAGRKMSVRDMPPLYVSLPDPNHVDVQIRAYDRTGHESKWISVDASVLTPR